MGGPGSTRWHGYEKKTTVEECLTLPIRFFTSRDLIREGSRQRGIFRWRNQRERVETASVTYEVDYKNRHPVLWLFFVVGEAENWERIELESTSCNFGGVRWWMRCPSPLEKQGCENRRCGKLYLPPDGVFFACRECQNLTYQACQESNLKTQLSDSVLEDATRSVQEIRS